MAINVSVMESVYEDECEHKHCSTRAKIEIVDGRNVTVLCVAHAKELRDMLDVVIDEVEAR